MFFIGESTRLLIDDEEEEERDEEEVEISSFFSTLLCRSCLAAPARKDSGGLFLLDKRTSPRG